MADSIPFSWNGANYLATESFHYFNVVRLPENAPGADALKMLFCDGFDEETDPPTPINLREPVVGDNVETPNRAMAFLLP